MGYPQERNQIILTAIQGWRIENDNADVPNTAECHP